MNNVEIKDVLVETLDGMKMVVDIRPKHLALMNACLIGCGIATITSIYSSMKTKEMYKKMIVVNNTICKTEEA